MACTVSQRQRVCDAAEHLCARPNVEAVDVLAPQTDPSDRWTLDILLQPAAGGLPADMLDLLGSFQLTVRSVAPQGDGWQALAVA